LIKFYNEIVFMKRAIFLKK